MPSTSVMSVPCKCSPALWSRLSPGAQVSNAADGLSSVITIGSGALPVVKTHIASEQSRSKMYKNEYVNPRVFALGSSRYAEVRTQTACCPAQDAQSCIRQL